MATIKFTTNLPIGNNSPSLWQFNTNYFVGIPEKPGVYIVGVKIPVKGQGEKFCPLIVGQTPTNLKSRLFQHYKGTGSDSFNGNKELFDLSRDPNIFYHDIEIFENIYKYLRLSGLGGKYSCIVKKYIFEVLKRSNTGNNSLIWFPDPFFFNNYLGVSKSSYPCNNVGHKYSIQSGGDLDIIGKKAVILKKNIEDVKKIISLKFYFTFYECNSDNYIKTDEKGKTKIRETIEDNTKTALQTIGIHSYAKDKNSLKSFSIDLSAIQSDLVNMTGWDVTKPLIL